MASRRIVSAIRSVPVRGAHAPAVAASAAPSAETLALRAKEAGSWKSLSVEEKRQSLKCSVYKPESCDFTIINIVYRATYGQSRAEIQEASKSHDNTKVFAGVAIAVASGLLLSKFFNSLGMCQIKLYQGVVFVAFAIPFLRQQ
jgi:hypothetical protein